MCHPGRAGLPVQPDWAPFATCSKWWMVLYLYSTFLVLMTTQSSLQYSFPFTQSHTHSYSASISSTLLFYEAQFKVQHLAQGHFSMQNLGRLGIELQVGWRPLYPLSHSRTVTRTLVEHKTREESVRKDKERAAVCGHHMQNHSLLGVVLFCHFLAPCHFYLHQSRWNWFTIPCASWMDRLINLKLNWLGVILWPLSAALID